jgi:hypothetical protein
MAFQYSPKIVTNGLSFYVDASNTKSFVSGSTVWNDLTINSNNGTLTNGPTFSRNNGGSIVFDGVDDRVSQTSSINTGDNFTVNAWIYPTLLGTTRRAIVGNSYNYSTRRGWLFCTAGGSINNTFFLSIGGDNAGVNAPANTLSLNTWVYVSATCQNGGGSINLYKNGTIVNNVISTLSPGNILYDVNQFNIGFRFVGGTQDPYTGNIASVSIYNRVLTADEIFQNYNATKSRFGLT